MSKLLNNMINVNELTNLDVFREISREDLESMSALMVEKEIKKGEIIVFEGMDGSENDCKGLMVVKSGRMKTFKTSKDGREYIFYWIRPGELFYDVSIFENAPPKVSVAAHTDSCIYCMKEHDLKEMMKDSPGFRLFLFRNYARRTSDYIETVGDLAFKNVQGRLAKVLMETAEKESQPLDGKVVIKRDITLYDLASMVGTVREVVTRTLQKFEKDGILTIDRKHIVIDSLERLEEIAGE